MSIQDEAGELLAVGESGEVCAQAGNYMREYWNRPEETAAAFRDGWYHTGDAGYLDRDGYLYLVDRVKDMIVTGGENVYSAEVENSIASQPGVAQVAVIGIPSEQCGGRRSSPSWSQAGRQPSPRPRSKPGPGTHAGYKVPKTVEFRTEPLPLSGAMKVLKRELRPPYWEGRDRAVIGAGLVARPFAGPGWGRWPGWWPGRSRRPGSR